jgi:hypothetical protein
VKMKMNRKIAVSVIAVLIFSIALGATVFADDNFKTLKAWFGNLSIYRNNQLVQLSVKPFIVDGTTYVPLRAVSELFNKDVGWDGVNYKIDLNDRPDENLIYMTQQLYSAQLEIQTLQAKIKQLEESAGKKSSLKDLKSYLNEEYRLYEGIKFNIELDENKNDIEVCIYVDLGRYEDEWDDLYRRTSRIEKYLQNIANDILGDYKNVSIEGSIMDSSKKRNNTLLSFYTKSNGTVVLTDKDYGRNTDLGDLKEYLNSKYSKCYNYRSKKYVYFDIELYGDEDDIEVYIAILGYVEDYDIEEYLEELYEEITDEFKYADVYGYIEDDDTDYYFDFNKWGEVYLDW